MEIRNLALINCPLTPIPCMISVIFRRQLPYNNPFATYPLANFPSNAQAPPRMQSINWSGSSSIIENKSHLTIKHKALSF
jgi:hypothetical protein